MLNTIKALHTDLKARFAKYLRTREVISVLSTDHARELRETPWEQWPLTKQRHLQEVQAVRDGKVSQDVIDRRSWAYPYLPEALHRLNQPILKATPPLLRKFSETPLPRRAINLIKNAILSQPWTIQPTEDEDDITPEREKRIRIVTKTLMRPNNKDSFRDCFEAVLEDLIVGGFGTIEPRMTPYIKRPFKLWAVDGSTIRIYADWSESTPEKPHYAQMTGLKGERGIISFLDDELIYIRDNVRTNTPFGLGKCEVAFNTINAFLGAQDMAAKAGADQVHKTWLWWKTGQNPAHVQTIRRHIQNEAEGQAKVSLMAGMPTPEVVDITPVKPEDLLLDWQKFLIEVLANAFDLSPMALGQSQHVNKANGATLAEQDFRSAVIPMARRLEQAITHFLHSYMGWKDLEFVFTGLEDPDANTRMQIQQRQYMVNAITPDEIRADMGLPPLPGGWGRLTQGQMQLLQAAETGKAAMGKSQFGGGMPGAPGAAGIGGPSKQNGLPPAGNGMGSGSIGAGMFSAGEVARMAPEDIQRNIQFGLLPPDAAGIQQGMEDEQPGILETLSEQLKDFFKLLEKLDDENTVEPQKVTNADQRKQEERYREAQHTPSLIEKVVNNRGARQTIERRPNPNIYTTPVASRKSIGVREPMKHVTGKKKLKLKPGRSK